MYIKLTKIPFKTKVLIIRLILNLKFKGVKKLYKNEESIIVNPNFITIPVTIVGKHK